MNYLRGKILLCGISVLILALSLLSVGCTATVTPPEHPLHPVAVYVADYGHHSSVFLPVEKTAFIEYSFGDWNYYVLNHSSFSDAFEALFYSRGSAFGRRYAPRMIEQNEPIPYGKPRIFSICVAKADVERVRSSLEAQWKEREASRVHNTWDDTDFIVDDRRYSWTRDCNEVTAGLLRDLGCQVEGATYLSHFYLSEDAAGMMEYCE